MHPPSVRGALGDLFALGGRVAIVTGGGTGLGARFAKVLHELGATVVVAGRRIDRLETVAGELERCQAVQCDVSMPGSSERLVEDVVTSLGRLDIAIANAGISNDVPALRETAVAFADVVAVDLVAPFELARASAQAMRQAGHGGAIVAVASAAAVRSWSRLPHAGYVAAKAGLVGLTRELALQWARYGIRVNALCPGMFPTELSAPLTADSAKLAAFESTVPLGRIGRPHELDAAIAFLVSDASSYMTGHSLLIDGGLALD